MLPVPASTDREAVVAYFSAQAVQVHRVRQGASARRVGDGQYPVTVAGTIVGFVGKDEYAPQGTQWCAYGPEGVELPGGCWKTRADAALWLAETSFATQAAMDGAFHGTLGTAAEAYARAVVAARLAEADAQAWTC